MYTFTRTVQPLGFGIIELECEVNGKAFFSCPSQKDAKGLHVCSFATLFI